MRRRKETNLLRLAEATVRSPWRSPLPRRRRAARPSLGLPGLAYSYGVSALWIGAIYPLAIYGGVALGQGVVARYGNDRGHRSIPEFVGDRFQSDAIRVAAALLSLALFFFLAAQLVAGLAMFQMFLGLDKPAALGITSIVLTFYVLLGGAHADILTDAVQGGLMLLIAGLIFVMFVLGDGPRRRRRWCLFRPGAPRIRQASRS